MLFDPTHYWYRSSLHPFMLPLVPLSWLFGLGVKGRRWLYRLGVMKTTRFDVPVIVVGNITVGGTGKTPFTIWLAKLLQAHGLKPGMVSRGVGGKKHSKPHWVKREDSPHDVGDEAILLKERTGCPLVIGINRVDAVRELLDKTDCNIVLSDDGLQHYRLHREIEIVMVDGERHFGNKQLLPAGPLRESTARLKSADFVMVNGGQKEDAFTMTLHPSMLVSVKNQQEMSLKAFPHKKVHAVAAIGHPERFFQTLSAAGFEIIPHVFKDHYLYQPQDLHFSDSLPIIMTEKDAVKCHTFSDSRYWYLRVDATMTERFEKQLLEKLTEVCDVEDFTKRACCGPDRIRHNPLGQ